MNHDEHQVYQSSYGAESLSGITWWSFFCSRCMLVVGML